MDDKNVKAAKINDKTQVFVLPPELLKGILLRNKKYKEIKVDDANNIEEQTDQRNNDDLHNIKDKEVEVKASQDVTNKIVGDAITSTNCKNNIDVQRIDNDEVHSNLIEKSNDLLDFNTESFDTARHEKYIKESLLQSDQSQLAGSVVCEINAKNQNGDITCVENKNDKFSDSIERNDFANSCVTSQTKEISCIENDILIPIEENQLNNEQMILNGDSYEVQTENEFIDDKMIYEEIEIIIEEIIEEPTSNETLIESQILNHADLSHNNINKMLVDGNNVESGEQNFTKEQVPSSTVNTERNKIVKPFKTYINKKKKNNEFNTKQSENCGTGLSDNMTPTLTNSSTNNFNVHNQTETIDIENTFVEHVSLGDFLKITEQEILNNNISEMKVEHELNERKVSKTRNRSKSTHHCISSDLESSNVRTRSKSLSMDIKNSNPKLINSNDSFDFTIPRSQNIKILKLTKNTDVNVKKENLNSKQISTSNENKMHEADKNIFVSDELTENRYNENKKHQSHLKEVAPMEQVTDQKKLEEITESKQNEQITNSNFDELKNVILEKESSVSLCNGKQENEHDIIENEKLLSSEHDISKESLSNVTEPIEITPLISRDDRDEVTITAKTDNESYSSNNFQNSSELVDETLKKSVIENENEKNNITTDKEIPIDSVNSQDSPEVVDETLDKSLSEIVDEKNNFTSEKEVPVDSVDYQIFPEPVDETLDKSLSENVDEKNNFTNEKEIPSNSLPLNENLLNDETVENSIEEKNKNLNSISEFEKPNKYPEDGITNITEITTSYSENESACTNLIEPDNVLTETHSSNMASSDILMEGKETVTAAKTVGKGKRRKSLKLIDSAHENLEDDCPKRRRTRQSSKDVFETKSEIVVQNPNKDITEKPSSLELETNVEKVNKSISECVDQNDMPKKRRGRPPKKRKSNVKIAEDKSDDKGVCEKALINSTLISHSAESESVISNKIEENSSEKIDDSFAKRRGKRTPKPKKSNSDTTNLKENEKVVDNDKFDDSTKEKHSSESNVPSENNVGNKNNAETNLSENNQDQKSNLPKKRGRRRSTKVSESNNLTHESDEKVSHENMLVISNSETDTKSSSTPNGNNVEHQNKTEENVNQESLDVKSLPKRRRGRSRKANSPTPDVSVSEPNKNLISAEISNEICDSEISQKSLEINDEAKQNLTEGNPDSNGLSKKRRGRPRKSTGLNVSIPTPDEIVTQDEAIDNSNDAKINTRGSKELNDNKSPTRVTRQSRIENKQNNDVKKESRGWPSKSGVKNSDDLDGSIHDDALNDSKSQNTKCELNNDNSTSIEQEIKKLPSRSGCTRSNVKKNEEIASMDSVANDTGITSSEDCARNESSDGSSSSDDSNKISRKRRKRYSYGALVRRKRGRPKRGEEIKKSDREDEYVPHHSQRSSPKKTRKRKRDDSPELEVQKPGKMVKCGKCQKEMKRSTWSYHNVTIHNDLAWIEGTEKPDYDNDEKLLKRVLNVSIKRRKGNLICEICMSVKRSVAGYLSHVMFCGKDDEEAQALMITCPQCNAVVRPSSWECHEKQHKMQAEERVKLGLDEVDQDQEVGQRSKRKAAEKAAAKILEVTELVKDDKDNALDQKLKLNSQSLVKLVQSPKLTRQVPGIILNKWKKELSGNQSATCCQVGCQFSSGSLDELKNHYLSCNFKPQKNFICKICKFSTPLKSDVIKHVNESHSIEDDNEDSSISLSDAESSCSASSDKVHNEIKELREHSVRSSFVFKNITKTSNKMFRFIFKHGTNYNKYSKLYTAGFIWTLDFELRNYKVNFFEDYVPNEFKLLEPKQAISYVPEHEESMLTLNKKANVRDSTLQESTWKKWKRFEGQCVQDNPTFFTGGPVWAIAWLPIPTSMSFSEGASEYIAVSTHTNMNKEYCSGMMYSGKNIIQIWDVGTLNKKNKIKNPELAYAVIHEGGTIWSLEWCPSGCYQHENIPGFAEESGHVKRMGLLAAACSDGSIRVYSLIFPGDLPANSSQDYVNTKDSEDQSQIQYPIYDTEPSLMLVTNIQMYDKKQQTWQITKLSWSKESGHNVIVAGFSNGYVALWDLCTKSPMLRVKRGNTTFLMPYRHFPAHQHAVTMTCLISQDNKRFLATASLDRFYKFWDLEDITCHKNSFKKSYITDGAWLNNWCCALLASDDALNLGHNYLHCLPLRDYTYKSFNLFPTNSPCYTVSASDLGNSVAIGTLAGEVLAIFPQQLIYIRNMENTLGRKRMFSIASTVEIVDFQKTDNESEKQKKKVKNSDKTDYNFMPSSYDESKDRYGIKFFDKMSNFQKEWFPQKVKNNRATLTREKMAEVPPEQYPFMSVNRVAWNPNARNFLWLAAGYQNGFVRLIPFKSPITTDSWNNLLRKHVNKLSDR